MILEKVRLGKPIEGILVIDCHAHIGDWYNFHIPKNSIEEVIEVMDYLGINKICIGHHLGCSADFRRGNKEVGKLLKRFPERIIGYTVINPNYPDKITNELMRCEADFCMKMIKIHPTCHDYPVNGENYQLMWEYANKKGTVVLSHTGTGDKNCEPSMFIDIAKKYSNVKIILGHSGASSKGCEEAIKVAKTCPNTYLDTVSSVMPFGIIEELVSKVGADRILFGTDIPFLEASGALGRVAYAKISESDKEKILGLNMKSLLESIK